MKIQTSILTTLNAIYNDFSTVMHHYMKTESDNGLFYLQVGFLCFEARITT